jgi:hypothetical protein
MTKIAWKICKLLGRAVWSECMLVKELLFTRWNPRKLAPAQSCGSCKHMSFTGLRHGIGFECRKGMSGHPFDWNWGSETCSHYEPWTRPVTHRPWVPVPPYRRRPSAW